MKKSKNSCPGKNRSRKTSFYNRFSSQLPYDGPEKTWSREAICALNWFLRNREGYLKTLGDPDKRVYYQGRLNLSCVDLTSQEEVTTLWIAPLAEVWCKSQGGCKNKSKNQDQKLQLRLICCQYDSGGLLHLISWQRSDGVLQPLFKAEEWLRFKFPVNQP